MLALLLLIWVAPVLGSCVGYCGRQSDLGCWCDGGCSKNGDCCLDLIQICPAEVEVVAAEVVNACLNNCGGKGTSGCWCDGGCADYGDCCPDMLASCPEYKNTLSFPGQDHCKGQCGSHTASCWCDGGCMRKGDCCDDFEAICIEAKSAAIYSCAGYCNKPHPEGCLCDESCFTTGDCCPDFTLVCSNVKAAVVEKQAPTLKDAQAELVKYRTRFESKDLKMYEYHYRHYCDMCPAYYSTEKIITYTASQGITSVVDVDTKERLPLEEFSQYKRLEPDMWLLIQAGINENVPILVVDYDDVHGFPVLVEIDWGKGEFDKVYISKFKEKSGHLQGCTDEIRQCPDTFSVQRDPANACKFRNCSNIVLEDGMEIDPNPVLHFCESRMLSRGFCFTQDGQGSGITIDATSQELCAEYFNSRAGSWDFGRFSHFGQCAFTQPLCDETIEACMRGQVRQGETARLADARAAWDGSDPRVYSFKYQKLCTDCPPHFKTPKIVTVNAQVGITGMMDLNSSMPVPMAEWRYYLTVGQVFQQIERGLREEVTELKVTYGVEGLPTSLDIDWETGNADVGAWREGAISLSAFTNLGINVIDCSGEKKICPDGTATSRNPLNNCEFQDCTLGAGSFKEAREWCAHRDAKRYCWLYGSERVASKLAEESCINHYAEKVNSWLPERRRAFRQCTLAHALCSETIEECMEAEEEAQLALNSNLAKWRAHDLKSYSFHLSQSCTGCPSLYEQEVVVKVDEKQGIASMKELRTQKEVPVTEWRYFGTVDTFFKMVQDAMNEAASQIDVEYDPTYGIPISLFVDWQPELSLEKEFTRAELFNIVALDTGALGNCSPDKQRCTDGSLISRDPNDECKFPVCTQGLASFTKAQSLCKHRLQETGWCWMQAPETLPGVTSPVHRCVRYFLDMYRQWSAEESALFEQCARSSKLCGRTVEDCMYSMGAFAEDVEKQKQKWLETGLRRYQYRYKQECPACSAADSSMKLVTVDEDNGGVISVFDVGAAFFLPAYLWPSYKTVDELFQLVQEAVQAAADVRVEFHPFLAFPATIELDMKEGVPGDEILIQLSEFSSGGNVTPASGVTKSVSNGVRSEAMAVRSMPAGGISSESSEEDGSLYTGGSVLQCDAKLKVCRDGTRVRRDASMGCRYAPCPLSCKDDTWVCGDGKKVRRLPDEGCVFAECKSVPVAPLLSLSLFKTQPGKGASSVDSSTRLIALHPLGDVKVQEMCNARADMKSWCWASLSPGAGLTVAQHCLTHYNNHFLSWSNVQASSFKRCVQTDSLCQNGIEACMS